MTATDSPEPQSTHASSTSRISTGVDERKVDDTNLAFTDPGNGNGSGGGAAQSIKRKIAYVGGVEGVEKAIRWKRRCGIPLGEVAQEWRDVLPRELFTGQATLGDRADEPIDVDAI